MDSPETRALPAAPWLFSSRGLACLALVTALAATFLATDITYLGGALLLVGLTARAWSALAFARLSYSRRTSTARAFCGDEIALEAYVANPRPLPLPWVEVWEQLPANLAPDGPNDPSYVSPGRVWVGRGVAVWPYQRLRWRWQLRCRRRGVYRLGQIRLRTGDPFGFFERERVWSDDLEILAYPRVIPLRRLALPLHHPALDVASPASPVADPTRTMTLRDYRPDDARRLIHWPTTARRGSLQVRVLEPATSLHVSFMLDVRGFLFGIYCSELLELTLSAIASMAVYLQQTQSAPISVLANTNPPLVVLPGASVPHLQQVLESLARLQPQAGPDLLPWSFGDLPPGNTVILAASEMAADVDRMVDGLEDAGFRVLLLLARTSDAAPIPRAHAITLTPGCDLGARLEGRL